MYIYCTFLYSESIEIQQTPHRYDHSPSGPPISATAKTVSLAQGVSLACNTTPSWQFYFNSL